MYPVSCRRCGRTFYPRANLGEWECRAHPLGPDERGRYRCCGVPASLTWAHYLPPGPHPFTIDDVNGCLRLDHEIDPEVAFADVGIVLEWRRRVARVSEFPPPGATDLAALVTDPDEVTAIQTIVVGARAASRTDPLYAAYLAAGGDPAKGDQAWYVRRAARQPERGTVDRARAFYERHLARTWPNDPPPSVDHFY